MDEMSNFSREVNEKHQQMIRDLEAINVDNMKAEGVRISFGGKTFQFTDLEVINDTSIEERIRREFKDKLNRQQGKIREKINSKINQLLMMHQQKTQELDRIEEKLKRKYSDAALMPDILETHLINGLSVVKGDSNNELVWAYNAVYNPRYLIYYPEAGNRLRKPIPSRLVNRMKTNILILIYTKNRSITRVSTKKYTGDRRSRHTELTSFPHYHQTGNGDCWGNWSYKSEWENSDDILKVARDAEAILETINQGSLASRDPSGLPKIQTLINSVKDVEEITPSTVERENGNHDEDDVWQTS